MSAIWGAIDLSGKPINEFTKKIMKNSFEPYVIDRYEEKSDCNIYMGCGLQYFTDTSINEPLPIFYKDNYFTADVILDNRVELAQNISFPLNSSTPDGELLFSYITSKECQGLNDILGAYTLAKYNKKSNELLLACDCVGNRCLYYRQIGDVIYFSTLITTLSVLTDDTPLNDRYLTDFLAMDYLFMINETEETPYADIYRLAPAQFIKFGINGKEKEIYWKPFENFKEYNYESDEMYKQEFRQIWDEAVKCTMRSSNPISILLSGGFDSTAVAAIAAPFLKEQGKKLYSYTSVPMNGYQVSDNNYDIDDESENVQKTADFYGNIETNWIDLDGQNTWELFKNEFKNSPIPIKSVQNLLWLKEAMSQSKLKGSRIILTGSYGNTSISYTNLNVYMNNLYLKNKKSYLKEECKAFSSTLDFSYKYAMREIKLSCNTPYEGNTYPYKKSFVKRSIANKLKADSRIIDIEKRTFESSLSYDIERKNHVLWLALAQIGELHTLLSLLTGVIQRDPTVDKRLLDYCIHIPLEQYCKNGSDRRLVREYMKDIMPPHILNSKGKGKQSADLTYRFTANWENIKKEWIDLYEKHNNSKYVDTNFAKRQLIEQSELSNYSAFDLTRHMYTLQVLILENSGCSLSHISVPTEKPLLSVIIPVYNTKDTLKKCVDSVLNQTYPNIEILLIDDGSTDGSSDYCEKLATSNDKIKVYHQKNMGVSATRNHGIEKANGSLIAFIDSDDWIDSEMYEKLYELMIEHNADISCCQYLEELENGETRDFTNNRIALLYGNEILETLITMHDRININPHVGTKLYKKSLIANSRFANLRKFEDYEFLVRLFSRTNKVVFYNHAFYHYVKRNNSLTTEQKSINSVKDFVKSNQLQLEIIKTHVSPSALRKKYQTYYFILLDQYCNAKQYNNSTICKLLYAKEIHRIAKQARQSIKYKIELGRKDILHLYIGTYSPFLYKVFLKLFFR